MKAKITKMLLVAALSAAAAIAIPVDFVYNGDVFGTMDLTVVNSSTVNVDVVAMNVVGAGAFQITGFGFQFDNSYLAVAGLGVFDALGDGNSLAWIKLNNLSAIPNPANSSVITKSDYTFGVTEGKANNITPPGIFAGFSDSFQLNGFKNLLGDYDLTEAINLTGVRIQSLPNSINGGSLFLAGTPRNVPEPTTLTLLGLGLFGLLGLGRKFSK